jgi:adenylate cyclase
VVAALSETELDQGWIQELALSPGRPGTHYLIGYTRLMEEDFQAAMDEFELDPDPLWRDFGKSLALFGLQRRTEADDMLARLVDNYQHDGAFQIADTYAYRGEVDKAFEWLDRAYEAGDPGLSQILGEPLLASLFDDPRWPAFLGKMGLPTSIVNPG